MWESIHLCEYWIAAWWGTIILAYCLSILLIRTCTDERRLRTILPISKWDHLSPLPNGVWWLRGAETLSFINEIKKSLPRVSSYAVVPLGWATSDIPLDSNEGDPNSWKILRSDFITHLQQNDYKIEEWDNFSSFKQTILKDAVRQNSKSDNLTHYRVILIHSECLPQDETSPITNELLDLLTQATALRLIVCLFYESPNIIPPNRSVFLKYINRIVHQDWSDTATHGISPLQITPYDLKGTLNWTKTQENTFLIIDLSESENVPCKGIYWYELLTHVHAY